MSFELEFIGLIGFFSVCIFLFYFLVIQKSVYVFFPIPGCNENKLFLYFYVFFAAVTLNDSQVCFGMSTGLDCGEMAVLLSSFCFSLSCSVTEMCRSYKSRDLPRLSIKEDMCLK